MATLAELARFHTTLPGRAVTHLQRLARGVGPARRPLLRRPPPVRPAEHGTSSRFVVLGQIRPTTSQTVYRADWVGTVVDAEEPVVARSFRLGEIIEGEVTVAALQERVRVLAIPVRHRGEVIAVLTRESAPSFGRQPGELERIYVEVFNRFARMIAAGDFPFAAQDAETEEAPASATA